MCVCATTGAAQRNANVAASAARRGIMNMGVGSPGFVTPTYSPVATPASRQHRARLTRTTDGGLMSSTHSDRLARYFGAVGLTVVAAFAALFVQRLLRVPDGLVF